MDAGRVDMDRAIIRGVARGAGWRGSGVSNYSVSNSLIMSLHVCRVCCWMVRLREEASETIAMRITHGLSFCCVLAQIGVGGVASYEFLLVS